MQTKNAKVKLNLKDFTLDEKINKCKTILHSLTDNPDFPNPNPTLTEFEAAINKVESKSGELLAARQVVAIKQSQQEDAVEELDAFIKQLGAFVDSLSKGDESKILGAGFETRSTATRYGLPDAPENLQVVGVNENEVTLAWVAVDGAKSYVIEMTRDSIENANWVFAAVSTKSKVIVTKLERKTTYWFRVSALGAAGQGAWSQPCSKFVI